MVRSRCGAMRWWCDALQQPNWDFCLFCLRVSWFREDNWFWLWFSCWCATKSEKKSHAHRNKGFGFLCFINLVAFLWVGGKGFIDSKTSCLFKHFVFSIDPRTKTKSNSFEVKQKIFHLTRFIRSFLWIGVYIDEMPWFNLRTTANKHRCMIYVFMFVCVCVRWNTTSEPSRAAEESRDVVGFLLLSYLLF